MDLGPSETAGAVTCSSWPLDKGGGLLGRCLSSAGTSLMSTSCSPRTAQTLPVRTSRWSECLPGCVLGGVGGG